MSTTIDKDMLKEALTRLSKEEPDFVEKMINDVLDNIKKNRKSRLEQIVKEDFEQYDDVFKALA
jgi:ribosomal protein S7